MFSASSWLVKKFLKVKAEVAVENAQKKHSAVLDLHSLELDDVPAELCYFSAFHDKLQCLCLQRNDLTTLPSDFGVALSQLKFLYLDQNKLTELPMSMRYLGRLKKINISHNQFHEGFPGVLCVLPNLEVLWANDIGVQSVPWELGELTKLKVLGLRNNRLTEIPSGLYECTSLVHISLRGNELQDFPEGLLTLPNLVRCSLDQNFISQLPEDYQLFTGAKKLRYLCMRRNMLEMSTPVDVQNVKRLIRKMPRLKYIYLDGNPRNSNPKDQYQGKLGPPFSPQITPPSSHCPSNSFLIPTVSSSSIGISDADVSFKEMEVQHECVNSSVTIQTEDAPTNSTDATEQNDHADELTEFIKFVSPISRELSLIDLNDNAAIQISTENQSIQKENQNHNPCCRNESDSKMANKEDFKIEGTNCSSGLPLNDMNDQFLKEDFRPCIRVPSFIQAEWKGSATTTSQKLLDCTSGHGGVGGGKSKVSHTISREMAPRETCNSDAVDDEKSTERTIELQQEKDMENDQVGTSSSRAQTNKSKSKASSKIWGLFKKSKSKQRTPRNSKTRRNRWRFFKNKLAPIRKSAVLVQQNEVGESMEGESWASVDDESNNELINPTIEGVHACCTTSVIPKSSKTTANELTTLQGSNNNSKIGSQRTSSHLLSGSQEYVREWVDSTQIFATQILPSDLGVLPPERESKGSVPRNVLEEPAADPNTNNSHSTLLSDHYEFEFQSSASENASFWQLHEEEYPIPGNLDPDAVVDDDEAIFEEIDDDFIRRNSDAFKWTDSDLECSPRSSDIDDCDVKSRHSESSDIDFWSLDVRDANMVIRTVT